MNKKIRKTPGDIFLAIVSNLYLTAVVLTVLVPVLWMISASLTSGKLLSQVPILPNPAKFSFEHYRTLFTYTSNTSNQFSDYVTAFFNTLQIAVLTTVGVVITSTLAGFAFSRFKFKGRKSILLGFITLQMFPSFTGMVAIFLLFRAFGWYDNIYALVFIYVTGAIPGNIFIIRGYMRNIPKSLDEAASIDGASKLQTLTKIILPLSMPIVGFVALTAFMSPWMDFILPSILLKGNNPTVAMWLYRTTDPFNTLFYNPLLFMAGALLLAIPIMAVSFYTQKFIVFGLTAGADKG
jgi:arabinogalactan oligomer/maltooligosaccharide transport system permease protein